MNELQIFEKLLVMVGNAGEGAFWLFIMWIAKDYFTATLIALTISFLASMIVRRAVQPMMFAEQIAPLFGFTTPLTRYEKETILETIKIGLKSRDAK